MPKRQLTTRTRFASGNARNRPRGIRDIMLRMRAMPYVVYWLFDDTCTDPATDGYVGSTGRLIERISNQMRNPALPIGGAVKFKILFRGNKRACLTVEGRLRPVPGIGWNEGPGVSGHGRRGKPRRLHRAGFPVTP